MSVSVEDLKANAVQFGHKTARWNPKMKRYLYGTASGVHIFDLNKTLEHLNELLEYLKTASSHGKTILFVSTKPQSAGLIQDLALKTGNPYVTKKWFGGTLTNFDTMKERIRYYKNLVEERETGAFDRFTKKEVAQKNKEIEKLASALGGITNLRRVPDVVFVVDAKRDKIAVNEAKKLGVPVVGFCDSNADPDVLDVFVPANDDALKSLMFLIGLVEKALGTGGKRPNTADKNGAPIDSPKKPE
jgi:small subunit ribosomal protein S2